MGRAASNGRFSVSDGKWSRVSSNLSSALNAMHSYWRERFASAERECTRLTLGEKHPDVDRALDDLRKYSGNTKQTVTQLKKDYNEWLREARKLRSFANEDRDAIRDAICRSGEYEVERRVGEIADRWASQISSAYGTTLGQADRLRSRAEDSKIQKYNGSKWVLAALKTNLASLENLKNYEMRGSANPKIRARIEWGKKRHADLQNGCAITEMVIERCDNAIRPGSGCRADCLKISSGTCKLVEIKPDSDGGKSEGRPQLDAYVKGLRAWYAADRKDLFSDYAAVAACENDDKTGLRIESEVIFYDFCSGTVKDELGEVIKELSSDMPENPE